MTISEIARMAGVSSAAVSRYLNNGSLSQEKRERIGRVIEETAYRPSEYARTLRTKKSRRISVVVPQIDSESTPRILSGINEVLDQEHYHVLLMDSARNREKELLILEECIHSQADGLILAASVITEDHRELLARMPFPVVILGQKTETFTCVYHNDYQASYDMMRYLLTGRNAGEHSTPVLADPVSEPLRSSRPACLFVDDEDPAAGKSRRLGAEAALRELGFLPEQVPREIADFTLESGYQAMERLISRDIFPDTLFCATDLIAAGAVSCLRDHGLSAGSQVRVAGIGHGMIADILTPRLTTVHYHYKTSGREAARLLLEKIESPRTPDIRQQLDYYLVVQGTA